MLRARGTVAPPRLLLLLCVVLLSRCPTVSVARPGRSRATFLPASRESFGAESNSVAQLNARKLFGLRATLDSDESPSPPVDTIASSQTTSIEPEESAGEADEAETYSGETELVNCNLYNFENFGYTAVKTKGEFPPRRLETRDILNGTFFKVGLCSLLLVAVALALAVAVVVGVLFSCSVTAIP